MTPLIKPRAFLTAVAVIVFLLTVYLAFSGALPCVVTKALVIVVSTMIAGALVSYLFVAAIENKWRHWK